ncbi:unnamed protein product [Dracunculus medinensis]|uniref:TAZ-type domain-containing protein n=1 Tax=Dracunculus medinensis TaxID=318479 RepID=A0A0N4UKB5_DRAME|nr:unnamed protein product [Dracunculus medinensis]
MDIFNENNNSCVQAISTNDSAMSSYESSNKNFANGTSSNNECGKNMEYDEISAFCHLPFIKIIYNFVKTDGCKPICICKKGYTKNEEQLCILIRTHPLLRMNYD